MNIMLSNTRLFRGIGSDELPLLLQCLGAAQKHYDRGETILAEGAPTEQLGMVLTGMAMIGYDDVWGSHSLLGHVLTTCTNACPFHAKLIQNLLTVCAAKNLQLSQRILHTTPKGIRARLMSYFSECVKRAGQYSFDIPYNRQQLADYLGVDRSAMCSELSRMQREGLLTYHKNHFSVHEALE